MTYHPDIRLLESYVRGDVSAVDGVTIATHLETCDECRSIIERIEESESETFEALGANYDKSLDGMLNSITSLDVIEVPLVDRHKALIEVNGKTFSLPQSLSRFTSNMSEWRSYGGKVFSSTIELGESQRVNLLYISEGVQVPQHTHKGTESTLVLHGSFSDEDGEYHAGDFLVADATVKHSPRTREGQDCLCLTVLSEPMIFTQGVARVFNMFGQGMYP